MKIKSKFLLFLMFSAVFFDVAVAKTAIFEEGEPRQLGSEFAPRGVFSKTFDVYRLMPVLSYMRAGALVNIAKDIVQRDDFIELFDNLDESKFKMEVRRQYFLYTKGKMLDSNDIRFSVLELLNAQMLDDRIENANETGELDLSGFRISSLYGLSEVVKNVTRVIKKLNLSRNSLVVISDADFLYGFSRVIYLDLSYNRIAILEKGCFDELRAIEFIDLGNNQLAVIPSLLFMQLNKLKGLDLSDNKLRAAPQVGENVELNMSDN